MFTRKQYMAGECTHRQYYAQFVSPYVIAAVSQAIGKRRILQSTNEHFNDIPLREWDCIGKGFVMAQSFEACGDFATLAGLVCIAKEAAQQIKESS